MPTTTHRSIPYPAGSDAPDINAHIQAIANAIDGAAVDSQGLLADLPSGHIAGRYYYATDTGTLQRDNGTTWVTIVTDADSRLTNQRTPTDNTVTTVKIVDLNVTTAKIANNAVTAAKIETQQAWTQLTLGGGTWSLQNLGLMYMKDSLGFVHIRGGATVYPGSPAPTNIASGTTIATFPVGTRPEVDVYFKVMGVNLLSNPSFYGMSIGTDGTMKVRVGSGIHHDTPITFQHCPPWKAFS